MLNRKIGRLEAISVVLVVMINHIILNLPKLIIRSTTSGAILNVLFVSIIALGVAFLISKLFQNFPQADVLDISKFLGGKWLKNLVRFFIFVVLCFCSWSFTKGLFRRTASCIFSKNNRPYYYAFVFNCLNCHQ